MYYPCLPDAAGKRAPYIPSASCRFKGRIKNDVPTRTTCLKFPKGNCVFRSNPIKFLPRKNNATEKRWNIRGSPRSNSLGEIPWNQGLVNWFQGQYQQTSCSENRAKINNADWPAELRGVNLFQIHFPCSSAAAGGKRTKFRVHPLVQGQVQGQGGASCVPAPVLTVSRRKLFLSFVPLVIQIPPPSDNVF